MKKIIIVGGEDVSARIDFANQLRELNYEVIIFGSEDEMIFNNNKILYYRYPLIREFNLVGDIKSVLILRNYLSRYKENLLIHTFDTKPNILVPIASIGLKNLKIIRTINGMGRLFTDDIAKMTLGRKSLVWLFIFLQRLIIRKVHFTIFQNTENFNYFCNNDLIDINKTKVIKGSGIDVKKYASSIDEKIVKKNIKDLSLDRDQITFILVSRLVKQKGILNYLEAAKYCIDSGLRYNFLLVGQIEDGTDSVSLDIINKYSPYVIYLGKRKDIRELLAISDVFVLPTYYSEGLPRVLLEASAIGLAILTTTMPGCTDILKEGYNGFFVKKNDSLDLSQKIINLAQNRQLISLFKKNSRILVKDFDLSIVTRSCSDVYEYVTNN